MSTRFNACTMLLLSMEVSDGELWAEGSVAVENAIPTANTRHATARPDDLAAFKAEWNRRAGLLRRLNTEPTP